MREYNIRLVIDLYWTPNTQFQSKILKINSGQTSSNLAQYCTVHYCNIWFITGYYEPRDQHNYMMLNQDQPAKTEEPRF